jgi:hypothetical protein
MSKELSDKLSHDLWVNDVVQIGNRNFYSNCETHKLLMMLVGINKVIQQTEDLEYKAFCEIQYNELKYKL